MHELEHEAIWIPSKIAIWSLNFGNHRPKTGDELFSPEVALWNSFIHLIQVRKHANNFLILQNYSEFKQCLLVYNSYAINNTLQVCMPNKTTAFPRQSEVLMNFWISLDHFEKISQSFWSKSIIAIDKIWLLGFYLLSVVISGRGREVELRGAASGYCHSQGQNISTISFNIPCACDLNWYQNFEQQTNSHLNLTLCLVMRELMECFPVVL